MGRRGDWVLVVALLMCQPVEAAPPPAEPAPDLELLEFLGTWRAEDGTWVDPNQFADDEAPSRDDPGSSRTETSGKRQSREREQKADSSRSRDGSRVPTQGQTDDPHAY